MIIRKDLITTQIKGADNHRVGFHTLGKGIINPKLLFFSRTTTAGKIEKFGSKETDTHCTIFFGIGMLGKEFNVGGDVYVFSIPCLGWKFTIG